MAEPDDMVPMFIRVPRDLKERAHAQSVQMRESVATIMRMALTDYLERVERKRPPR